MKDIEENINLIDKQIIQNLHFIGFTFANSPVGKILLDISFVFSK
ncbi:MAG: hypothetical protein KatS3mg092_0481 [Patescibacteria group bacterium]|nr:MAG: hypothetical protein KatS3mg092_0481 [Patescibacteria group bacterium]